MPKIRPERIVVRCAQVWQPEEDAWYYTDLVEIHRAGQENVYFIRDMGTIKQYDSLCAHCAQEAKERLDAIPATPMIIDSPEVVTRVLDAMALYEERDRQRINDALAEIVNLSLARGLNAREPDKV